MRYIASIFALFSLSTAAMAQNEVVMRCGMSAGHAYYFANNSAQTGGEWTQDQISTGEIVLVRLDEDWDIVYADARGGHSYLRDGADVFLMLGSERFLTIAAVLRPHFSDIYTFDFEKGEVSWTTHKISGLVPKVASYTAKCE